jgi:hypothetical protein
MTQTPGDAAAGGSSETPPGWAPVQPPPRLEKPPAGPPPAAGWHSGPPNAPGYGWGGPPPAWGPPPPQGPGAARPGVIPLRPLGVGEVLDGAITSIRQHPKAMLGLTAILAAVTQVISVPLQIWLLSDAGQMSFSVDTSSSGQQDAAALGAQLVTAGITLLTTLVAVIVLTGVLTVVVGRAVLGQRITVGEAWALARPRLGALVGVTLLVMLLVLGAIALLLAPGIVLAVTSGGGFAVLLIVLGALAAVAAALYLYTRFALAAPAVVLEKQPVVNALRRSTKLVHPSFWRVFGILILVNVIAFIVSGILAVPFNVATIAVAWAVGDGETFNIYGLLPALITAIGTIVGAMITWPFTAAATALLYIDQRMRREGLDIELARAAGVNVAPPAGQWSGPGGPTPPGAGGPPPTYGQQPTYGNPPTYGQPPGGPPPGW